jgi:hypothetical protein
MAIHKRTRQLLTTAWTLTSAVIRQRAWHLKEQPPRNSAILTTRCAGALACAVTKQPVTTMRVETEDCVRPRAVERMVQLLGLVLVCIVWLTCSTGIILANRSVVVNYGFHVGALGFEGVCCAAAFVAVQGGRSQVGYVLRLLVLAMCMLCKNVF